MLPLFVTQESALIPNVTILSDNLSTCALHTQKQSTFVRWEVPLTLKGKNSSPFWNELSAAISNGLSLPTLTDCVDSGLSWLSGCANNMKLNSWFSTTVNSRQNKNLFTICCPSSTASVLGFMGWESTEEKLDKTYGKNPFKKSQNVPPNSVAKIPIFPCKELHAIWKRWLAAYRWVYNQCVEFFNSGSKLRIGVSLDQYVQQLQKEPKNQWTQCLGKTRQEAVCEAQAARKQAYKAWLNKPKEERKVPFSVRFRSARDKSQTIQFKNDAYSNGTWFPKKVEGLLYCTAWGYEVPYNCDYGTELVYQRGQWFACFPRNVPKYQTTSDKVIALDPGVRTFLTGFDGENVLEIAKGDIGRITRLCLHLDKLIGRKIKALGPQFKKFRYKLNKAINKLRFRVRCLIDDLHRKTTSFLVKNYKLIFLPTYETSQMVVKNRRKINRKSVRSMLSWSMGRFASQLSQAAKRAGVVVVRTNESYTSKTCSHCGSIHTKLGGSKVFKCPSCGFRAPRDWVGAFNILLSALQAIAFSVQDGVISVLDADVRVAQLREDCEA